MRDKGQELCMRYTISFKAGATITFSDYSGYAVQGFFYKILSSADRSLADEIHASTRPAPYAVTPIMDAATGEPIFRYLSPERIFYFNISALSERLCRALNQGLLTLDGISFNEIQCKVEALDFQLIDIQEFWRSAVPVRKFSVRFITPTRFTAPPRNVSDLLGLAGESVRLAPPRSVYFPDPERMLVSLLNFWVANLGEPPISEEAYRKWLQAGGVACSGYPHSLRTVSLRPGGSSIGFYGEVHYALPNDFLYTPIFSRFTDCLLRLGEIFNTGDERTAGLGMIRYRRHEICS
ncbi:MAG: CRISPR system precrRNA processing endoribonuclease RAMP protein Cas6 [Nitrososphaerota archaeon]|nr:CRISPR system precrRNA processing endoribonuclease RAMP protein Cas6 [Nitrososphaerota archaeon]